MNHKSRVIERPNNGLYIEEAAVADGRANTVFIAPHGGAVEPRTADQAMQAALSVDESADMWGTRGYHRDGPFSQWHPPSDAITPRRHRLLETALSQPYANAVSFHLKEEDGITIGGRRNVEERRALGSALEWITEDIDIVTDGKYGGQSPSNIVNRLSKDGGIQIETGPNILYRNSRWDVARSVADTILSFDDAEAGKK